jgi:hypothetical protein
MGFYIWFSPYLATEMARALPDHYVNAKKNHECVEFVRQVTGAPSTKAWRPGIRIKGSLGIPEGVAIATFKGRDFSTHAAIYLSQDNSGIWVLDQWNSQGKVAKRCIYFPTAKRKITKEQNNGDLYFAIDLKATEAAAKALGEPTHGRTI